MSTNQAGKLAHQLILLTNAFLDLVIECEEKIHICHSIGQVASEAVRQWLAKRNKPTLKTLASAFLLIFYLRLVLS